MSDRTGTRVIYTASSDGSGVRALTAGEAPAWSADGKRIAFYRAGTGIWVIDAGGTNEKFLRAGSWPAWSPDGTKIAYAYGEGSTGGIFVMNTDGSSPRLLISNEFANPGYPATQYGVFSPAWSPDGRTIAFIRANFDEAFEVYVMNVDGSGAPGPVQTGWAKEDPSWSPDGSRLAFGTVGFVLDPATGAQRAVDQVASATPSGADLRVHATATADGYVGDPDWSPDGRRLVFTRSSPRGTPTRIFVVREDGSVGQLIPEAQGPANTAYSDRQPAWSRRN